MQHTDRKTIFAAKPAPFGTIRKVPPTEARRWYAGQRRPIKTTRRRDWTHDEIEHLTTLLDKGLDYPTIARRLGRTHVAIVVKTKRLRCKMTKRPTVLTARQVADLLGKGCSKSVAYWIKRGYLKARVADLGRADKRGIWRVRWDDLMAFLQERRYWMAWEPARMTDPDLRAECSALRAGQGRWLSIGDVARRYHVISKTVGQWIHKGFLPAVRYGNWWIWSGDLEGWVPPCERSKAGIPKGMGRVVVGKCEIRQRAA